jgi:hypothetical protein
MSNDDHDEVSKKVKDYEKSLPDSQRKPNAQKDFENLIERASKPLPKDGQTLPLDERYNGKQTHLHKTKDTSD